MCFFPRLLHPPSLSSLRPEGPKVGQEGRCRASLWWETRCQPQKLAKRDAQGQMESQGFLEPWRGTWVIPLVT